MNTSALIIMIAIQSVITLMTIYFFARTLKAKPTNKED